MKATRIRPSIAIALVIALAAGAVAVAQVLPEEYRTPQGTRLRPAGTQIETSRAPTGVDVAPNSQLVFVINSGPFEQKLDVVDANTPRDAYGLALNEKAKKVYVSNWADETNPARARGKGTISVVDISKRGDEREVQVIPVGHHPTGLAISPDLRRPSWRTRPTTRSRSCT